MNFPIDFVVTWVDGSDPIWREKKANIPRLWILLKKV